MFNFIKNKYPDLLEKIPSLKNKECGCGGMDGILQMLISEKIKEHKAFPDGFNELEYNDRRMIMNTLKIINTHGCIKCTMKHLASSIVEMGELRKGYWNTDHEIFCMGNLTEASEQIDEYSNDIAMAIRELRIDIFETQKAVTDEHLKTAKELFWKVKKIGEPSLEIKTEEQAKNPYQMKIVENKSGCCGKGKPNA